MHYEKQIEEYEKKLKKEKAEKKSELCPPSIHVNDVDWGTKVEPALTKRFHTLNEDEEAAKEWEDWVKQAYPEAVIQSAKELKNFTKRTIPEVVEDVVNNPKHYKLDNGLEVIDFVENLSYNLGNVVKYIMRAGKKTKDSKQDLQKAQWYLNRELERLEKQ